jgi:hypothetical protein
LLSAKHVEGVQGVTKGVDGDKKINEKVSKKIY